MVKAICSHSLHRLCVTRFGLQFLCRIVYAVMILVFVTACGSSRRPNTSADQQIREVTDSFVAFSKQEPTLPGFKTAEIIATSAFAGRSRADADLLLGRIYYDSAARITAGTGTRWSRTGTPTAAAVRAELARPVATERFSRVYFDELLNDTVHRMSQDTVFSREIAISQAAALRPWNQAWDDYECLLDGESWPMTFCRSAWIFSWF